MVPPASQRIRVGRGRDVGVTRLRVVVAGGEAAGQRVLRSVAGDHEVVAVFAGSGPAGAPVRGEAERLGLPVLEDRRVKDATVPAEVGPIDLLLNVHRSRSTTLVLVTHDAELAGLADVRLTLRDGRPVESQSNAAAALATEAAR